MTTQKIPGFHPPPNPPVAGHYLTPIELTLTVLSLFALSLRLYSRLCILLSPGVDDFLVSVAWFLAAGVTATHVLSALLWGWGRHYLDLYQPDAVKLWIAELVHWIAYPLSALFVKLSMCCFFLRLSLGHPSPRRFRVMVYITMAFVTMWTLGLIITLLCSCKPLSKWWSYDPEGSCWDGLALGVIMFVQTTMNLISDVIVFVLPVRTVWRANVSRRKRMQMVGVLGLGLLVCVIALVRVKLLVSAIKNFDISWYGYSFYVAVAAEMHLCIICAAVPFCKPVLRLWREKLRTRGLWIFDKSGDGSTSIEGDKTGGSEKRSYKGWSRSVKSSGIGDSNGSFSGASGKADLELLEGLEPVYDPTGRRDSTRSLHASEIGLAIGDEAV